MSSPGRLSDEVVQLYGTGWDVDQRGESLDFLGVIADPGNAVTDPRLRIEQHDENPAWQFGQCWRR
jgi:hypothetical protein